jgi:hypothetical protein
MKKLSAAILAAIVLTGCARRSVPASATKAERHRAMIENTLISELTECQPHPLNHAQAAYLETHSEREAQVYLLPLGDPVCQWKWIRACETIFPGECVAVPGEVNGRRP